ncbi:MAG: YkgJ family cysteine cluster protein [Bacteroidia bacterium]|nr:YkgJ family cysteine cluster protein [Bacteroidia bacterium]
MNIENENAEEVARLSRQAERGQLFTHTELSQHASRINEVEAFLYGMIELMVKKGQIVPEELQQAVGDIRREIRSKEEEVRPNLALRFDPPDEQPAPAVNCAERLHICKAACCKLDFALSREEVEGGKVKWDLGRPYYIRHENSGYCSHVREGDCGCKVYADRPQVCRKYTCYKDSRIWKDFEKMELNAEWLEANLQGTRPRMTEARMSKVAVEIDPSAEEKKS